MYKGQLQERIERKGLQHPFGQTLVPSEKVMESRGGRRIVTKHRLFPGHIFIETEIADETWHLMKSTSKMTGFIGDTGDRPSPISKSEVDKIIAQTREGIGKPCPKTLLEVDEMVRVKEGPFIDFSGNVEKMSYEKSCLRVSMTISGRTAPVELEFGQAEKV